MTVFTDSYMVLCIISAGLDAAGRVMELSSPLALAGIPIFFITTYYSDFVLVPSKERRKVISALSNNGFELSENQSDFSFVYGRKNSTASRSASPPTTPPPSTASELQARAFDLLQRRSVSPFVADGLQLVQCSGREISQLANAYGHRLPAGRQTAKHRRGWIENVDTKLYTSMISALVSRPRFMSLTLAQDDPPSLLLDRNLLPLFGDSVVGDTDCNFVPIFLDLGNLSTGVTGIVCGVAGRLVQEMHMVETSELSYLSTARAGAVILTEEQSTRALAILRPLLDEGRRAGLGR